MVNIYIFNVYERKCRLKLTIKHDYEKLCDVYNTNCRSVPRTENQLHTCVVSKSPIKLPVENISKRICKQKKFKEELHVKIQEIKQEILSLENTIRKQQLAPANDDLLIKKTQPQFIQRDIEPKNIKIIMKKKPKCKTEKTTESEVVGTCEKF